MRITVIGGAGKMACISVQDLAQDPRVDEVVIADLNLDQAKVVEEYIKSPKITSQKVDVNDHASLVELLKGSDACLNGTVYYTNLAVMEACLSAGVHYTDMGGLFFTTHKQIELSDRFREAGLSAVLGMGSAPGIPNLQARYAADRLDTVESIKIYDGIMPPPTDDPKFTYAVPTIVDELIMEPMVYKDGDFKAEAPLSGFEDYWFTKPIGLLPMHLSLHSEVATLPISFKDKGVKECFFKINYWGMAKAVVEKIRVLAEFGFGGTEPVEVKGQSIIPRDLMVTLLAGYVPPITEFLAPPKNEPPNWVKEIVTEVQGTKDGQEMTFRLGTLTCKGALPTGVAPAIAAVWLAEGRVEPGVFPPEIALDPLPFFKELEERGIFTQVTTTQRL
ncbi:MAG TPA: saccharopine dehydrogenase NADP-binding domain-containing protein [Anaerolineales bacterium]|nr:saccharopine dehydrogenase NADP-binding domain-containing protein [Anaerolineales bacterium]